MSRIHDLDWSFIQEKQLTTCSHDASIKFWDTASPREPLSVIKAGAQPLWRARNYVSTAHTHTHTHTHTHGRTCTHTHTHAHTHTHSHWGMLLPWCLCQQCTAGTVECSCGAVVTLPNLCTSSRGALSQSSRSSGGGTKVVCVCDVGRERGGVCG